MSQFNGTFSLVTHNAVGTVHSFVRGFATVEAAEDYRARYAYAGVVNCPIVRHEDEAEIARLNDRWHNDARRLYLVSERLRQECERDWQEFLRRNEASHGKAVAS